MKTLTTLLISLQLAAAIAIPVVDSPASAELSGVYEAIRARKPNKAPGKSNHVDTEGVPHGTFLEHALDPSEAATPGGKVSVIKYGPYRVPAMGGLENRPSMMLEKPCSNCYIVAIQANLKYPDGSVANIDKGAWLHHMVMYNNGLTRRDGVCAVMPQRIFASGNERTPIRTNGKYKYGIEFGLGDTLGMLYDLMNESKEVQTMYIEMTYEWVPKSTPGYRPVTMAWLDITGCGASDTPAKQGEYELKSPAWRSTFSGRLLSATGHTHDGGAQVLIYKNGEPICDSLQLYGRKPAWIGGMDGMKMKHISDTGSCVDFGEIKPGDRLSIGAKYNTSAHTLNKNMDGGGILGLLGGGFAPIMGISQVYMGQM